MLLFMKFFKEENYMAFDINNFVIDRVIRGTMFSSNDGSVMYIINQIENPSLSISADEKTAVDAMGTTIASFNTAKNAELSAENSLFDLSLMATQMGTDKKVGSSSNKIVTPMLETIDVPEDASSGTVTVTLKYTPVNASADIKQIYKIEGSGATSTVFTRASAGTPSANEFAINAKELKLPTSLKKDDQILVMYETERANAVSVTASANEFPRAGKFVMEVLGCDVCNQSKLIYAYIVFPNAKLDSNVEVSFATDSKHPFSMKAQQNYCSKKKELFEIIIPDPDGDGE